MRPSQGLRLSFQWRGSPTLLTFSPRDVPFARYTLVFTVIGWLSKPFSVLVVVQLSGSTSGCAVHEINFGIPVLAYCIYLFEGRFHRGHHK